MSFSQKIIPSPCATWEMLISHEMWPHVIYFHLTVSLFAWIPPHPLSKAFILDFKSLPSAELLLVYRIPCHYYFQPPIDGRLNTHPFLRVLSLKIIFCELLTKDHPVSVRNLGDVDSHEMWPHVIYFHLTVSLFAWIPPPHPLSKAFILDFKSLPSAELLLVYRIPCHYSSGI